MPTSSRTSIVTKIAQPWRADPTIRPKVAVSAAGIRRMKRTSTKFESAVGFSNGIDELTLKKPPPLVPSCLIATCEAAGPTAIPCWPPASVVTSR